MRRTRGAQLRRQLAADRRAECARAKLRRDMLAARSITRASTVATRVFGNLPQECIIRIFEFKRRLELGHRLLWFRCWRLELDMWTCCWQQLWGTIVPPGQRVWGGTGPARQNCHHVFGGSTIPKRALRRPARSCMEPWLLANDPAATTRTVLHMLRPSDGPLAIQQAVIPGATVLVLQLVLSYCMRNPSHKARSSCAQLWET